jgi:hypothetical protein
MKKILIIFSALITLGVSCKKIDQELPKKNGPEIIKQTTAISNFNRQNCTPENPNNPMDNTGLQHNQIIDLTSQQINIYDEGNVQSAIDITNQYTATQYANSQIYIESEDQLESLMHDATNNMSNFVDALDISGNAKNYLNQLFTTLIDTPGISAYCDMKVRILAIEDAIAADGNINNLERKELFSATSIARYSYFYWSNRPEYGEENTERGDRTMLKAGKFLKWLKTGLTAIADAAGGIGGGIAGAKAAEGTGIDPGIGAVAGAIVGGTAASSGMAGLVDKVAGWFGG